PSAPKTPPAPAARAEEPPKPTPQADGTPVPAPEGPAKAGRHEEPPPAQSRASSTEETIRQRSSPLVRKIAKEHHVDRSQLHGTGIAGRVTKDDILAHIEGQSGQVGQVGQVGQEKPEVPKPERHEEKPAADR